MGRERVDVAGAVLGVERRTGLVVGEFFELGGGLIVVAQDSGAVVAGKLGGDARP